jgi:hypothetical protein
VKIEHVFARMKRFRILRERFSLRMERFDEVVRTIAVIHNLELDCSR